MPVPMQDYGVQDHGFEYRQEARARLFNRLLYDLVPPGIYSGFQLEKIPDTNTQINVTPGVCFIKDNSLEDETVAVRVRTTQNQGLDVSATSRPYIVLRFSWSDQEDNYMIMANVGFSSNQNEDNPELLQPNDLIVGKVLYDGSNNVRTVFDYTRRTNAVLPFEQTKFRELRVQSSEVFPKKVFLQPGIVYTGHRRLNVVGGNFPAATDIPDTTSNGRRDLVWIDEEGAVQFEFGTPSADPQTPRYRNRMVIAEIRRGPNRDSITGDEIVQIQDTNRSGTVTAADFLIADLDNYYTGNTVEAALKEVFEVASAAIVDINNSVKANNIDWGLGVNQVSAADVPIADTADHYTSLHVEGALAEVGVITSNHEGRIEDLEDHANTDATVEEVHGILIVDEII